jgi:hypothetical protein
MARRLIITAGWLAAAILAVLVGLVAISVIGDGITSPLARPLSQAEVERELAGASPAPSPSPSRVKTVPASPAPRSFPTAGGTVVARCDGGRATIVSMAPAQGFSVHERDGDEGEFRGVRDDHDRVKIEVTCRGGTPEAEIREETGD